MSDANNSNMKTGKKPIWKRWWFILGAFLLLGLISIAINPRKADDPSASKLFNTEKHGLEVTPIELLNKVAKVSEAETNDVGGHSVKFVNCSINWKDSAGYVTGSAFTLEGPVNEAYKLGVSRLYQWMSNIVGDANASKIQKDIGLTMDESKGTGEWKTKKYNVSFMTNSSTGFVAVFITPN